jgi:hypothetical protein
MTPRPVTLAGVNTGHGLYVCPGARVTVRDGDQSWPGYVTGDNSLGDLWVRDPDGEEWRVKWWQVAATR